MPGTEPPWVADVRASYDTVADSYAELIRAGLDRVPYLRGSLTLFAELVQADGGGTVLDAGCGPGHLTAFLRGCGVDAYGIDLSPGMIAIARRDHPDIRFEVGSMTDLDVPDSSVAGVVAMYSIIHVPDEAVPGVLAGFHRVLRPGGRVLVGFHVGTGSRRKTEGYGGHPMSLDVHRRTVAGTSDWLRAAGFTMEAQLLTDPDEPVPGALLSARRAG